MKNLFIAQLLILTMIVSLFGSISVYADSPIFDKPIKYHIFQPGVVTVVLGDYLETFDTDVLFEGIEVESISSLVKYPDDPINKETIVVYLVNKTKFAVWDAIMKLHGKSSIIDASPNYMNQGSDSEEIVLNPLYYFEPEVVLVGLDNYLETFDLDVLLEGIEVENVESLLKLQNELVVKEIIAVRFSNKDETAVLDTINLLKINPNVVFSEPNYSITDWNFDDVNFNYELISASTEISYRNENGIEFLVLPQETAPEIITSEKIKATEPLFNVSPYPMSDTTPLGLYIYGLPIGVTASVKQNTETQELTITLSGTATSSADIDLHPSITYLYSEEQNPTTIGQTIGDFDKDSIFALTGTISGITFKKQIRTSSSGSSSNTTIATPTANHKGGNVSIGTKLELSTTYKDGKIYYTLDGTTPSINSTLYTGAIPIDKSMTVKYIVVSNGKASPVVSQTFTVELPKTNWKEHTAQIKYIAGYEDNTFKPDTAISRYEMLTALSLLLEFEKSDSIKEFPDVPTEYKDIVNLFISSGIVEGYNDGTYK